VIRSFKDKQTESVFHGQCPAGFPANILKVARRKLAMIEAARDLKDLKSPPGNKLHELDRDRKGQYAIRINEKYRVALFGRMVTRRT
jgi:toxin HigB-1